MPQHIDDRLWQSIKAGFQPTNDGKYTFEDICMYTVTKIKMYFM